MELEGSLLCSQVTTTCPYLDPDQSSTWAATYFSHMHLNIASMPRSPKWSLSHFLTKTLYTSFFSFIYVTCPAYLILLDLLTQIIFDEEQHTGPQKIFLFWKFILASTALK